jgi:hypothetical protein
MAAVQSTLANRAKNMIVTPKTEWPVIDIEPTSIGDIYRSYVFPLAAIPAVAGLIGNMLFGVSVLGTTYRMSPVTAISGAVTQYIMSLIMVFVLALIIEGLAPTFGGTKNRTQAFKVAAYASTAGWVAGVLLILPQLALLVFLAGLYNLYLLYLGLPLLMRSPPEKALGYTVVTIVAAIVLGLIAGAIVTAAGSLLSPSMPIADATLQGAAAILLG